MNIKQRINKLAALTQAPALFDGFIIMPDTISQAEQDKAMQAKGYHLIKRLNNFDWWQR